MSLALHFWKECPDQISSALVASKMLKSLKRKAKSAGKFFLATELKDKARLINVT